jgi:penicillin-binding protein 1A
VIRITEGAKGWEMTQLPEVQAAFVSAVPQDGSIRAMVGGFDFSRNKFNRVTQAWRQPGSSFKPFIYSAALDKGFMTTTVINDAPVVVDRAVTGGQTWEPKNYDGRFDGPMTMRTGLQKSKNMVSIRLIQAIGPRYAQDYVTRFGFDAERHPPYLTMALGAGSVTPWQLVAGISVFANGGFYLPPHIIGKITDSSGKVLAQAQVRTVAEGQVLAGPAVDPEGVGVIEHRLVAVARRIGQPQPLALLDPVTADLGVGRRRAHEVLHRRHPADRLIDQAADQ